MSSAPKYRQVEDYIKSAITSGSLRVGSQIMTEGQLIEHFGYSRMTVNKALSNLALEGYIERAPGKGSFVSSSHIRKNVGCLRSFTEDMRGIGLEPGSELITYEVVAARTRPAISLKLELSEDDKMHYFVRLRTGDGKPIALSYTYVSVEVVPAIEVACLEKSFYGYLDSIGIRREFHGNEYRATLPTEEQKKLLGEDDLALLCVSHVTCTHIGGELVPFEYTETCYNGNVYTYVSEE